MRFRFLGERLVVDLLNTVIEVDGEVRDLLEHGRDVVVWAEAARVIRPGAAGAKDRALGREPRELRTFREQLRRGLAVWAATGDPSRRLVALLNRQMARDPEFTELRVRDGRARIDHASRSRPLDRLYGAIARSAAELVAGGTPERLRKCADPSCRLMFYDVSKGGRRRWCSMQTCGVRAKVRAFRERSTKRRRR